MKCGRLCGKMWTGLPRKRIGKTDTAQTVKNEANTRTAETHLTAAMRFWLLK